MGRRSGLSGLLGRAAREAIRAAQRAEKARKRELVQSLRERERSEKRAVRDQVRAEKDERKKYIDDRAEDAEDQTADIAARISELNSVLAATLAVNDRIEFDSLRLKKEFRPFVPPAHLRAAQSAPTLGQFTDKLKKPTGLRALVPGSAKRYERAVQTAREAFDVARTNHEIAERSRLRELENLSEKHNSELATFLAGVARRNAEVDDLAKRFGQHEPEAIKTYFGMVLERSEYPEGFPDEAQVGYSPESQELVVDYELPGPSIVPSTTEVKYVKARDEFQQKPRKDAECREIYQDVVASVALRTLHEVFEADHDAYVKSVVFNGHVSTVDPSTGQDVRPCLISVRVTRERFMGLDLGRVDKTACLRNLGAQVSPRAYETQAVKPIIEFDMVDRRFVEQQNIIGDLDARPNLMDLNPIEFENLVGNLFGSLGLDSKLTRSSRDGGVDVVAFDARPVLGGKVVIQAKRYKNTVGVSAVRDLFGTMMNEGANKGILVTTSGYGPDAFDFAKDKPIELISGGGLLYLLEQVGTRAKIVMPENHDD